MRLARRIKFSVATILFALVSLAMPLQAAHAASTVTSTAPAAKVSFTFDDGLASAYTQAVPTLAKYGFTGTDYVITGCVGMTTVPNTCHANTDAVYMSWSQVTALQNTYGWEIGSHTVSHPYLASSDATDGQPSKLTAAQVLTELTNSKSTLATNGINATDFASPYGDYNQAVLAQIAKLYASHRGYADTGYNAAPYNDYIIRDQPVQAGVSVATVEGYVDQAIANKQWLVLTFHDIQTNASTNPDDYQYNTADLDKIAAYVKSKSLPVVHVNDGLINGTNLLANPSFESGMTGWTTDAASNVVLDTANNGSYPNPKSSISMTSTTKNVHLLSQKVAVDPSASYILKSFLNLTKISSGYAMGYYIDEYDANGVWISGQYKQSVSFPWPQTAGFEYKPTSANVASASLQVIMPANSGAKAYVDNFQWINENTTVTPPVQANTIGKTTIGATGEVGGANYLDSTGPYTLSTNASVSKLTGYVKAAGSTVGHIRAIIYADNNGTPGALVAVSNEVVVAGNTAAGWTDFNLPAAINLAAGKYWLGYWYGGGVTVYEDIVTNSERYTANTYSATASPKNPYGTATTSASSYSLYVTYTPVTPTPTNLVANGSFDSGISGGWTTDGPINIMADTGNNGSPANPVNSVKMTAVAANTHLFSPKVALTAGKTYSLSTYVNIKQLTSGEVGFYMDEYDANGNWISGKYVTGARAVGSSTVSFQYSPTSANVKSAGLQIILVGNSGVVAYVDNVVWVQN